jgi:diguanylate cyclase (GGDEF)-like protein
VLSVNGLSESSRERADYAARIRRQNERLAVVVAGFLVVTSALPVTHDRDRIGVFVSALMVLTLAVVWFRILPPHAFGDRRVMVFGILAQPCVVALLALTGGLDSEYFSFSLLLVVASVFSPWGRHTLVVGVATVASLVLVGVLAPSADAEGLIADLGTRTFETAGFALIAVMIGRTLRASRAAIATRADELDEMRARAETLSLTDSLTGLYNRRYASDALDRLIADARRGRTFSVAAFDLDGFKKVNDREGHAAGDAVLIDFARVLRAGLREGDVAIRTGGDEFLVLLQGADAARATQIVDRLRAAARDARWGAPNTVVTASSGVTEWTTGQSADDLLRTADDALYLAKRTLQAA